MASLGTFCSLCLQEDLHVTNIFSSDPFLVQEDNFVDVIAKCAGVQIEEDDFASKDMCNMCKFELVRISKFSAMLKRSDLSAVKPIDFVPVKTELNYEDDEMSVEEGEDGLGDETNEGMESDQSEQEISDKSVEASKEIAKVANSAIKINDSKPQSDDSKKYTCNICNKDFLYLSNMQRHQRTIHFGVKPPPPEKCECDICGKYLFNISSLKRHRRQHTGDMPYKCGMCGKNFTDKFTLKRHLRYHSGERPFKCDVCDKAFVTPNNLKMHKRYHDGERPFECDVCGKRWTSASNLNAHRRSHDVPPVVEEQDFECAVCSKIFDEKSELIKHARTHADEDAAERPFECRECGKRFTVRRLLTLHVRRHKGERPYKCDDCGKCYAERTKLKQHNCQGKVGKNQTR